MENATITTKLRPMMKTTVQQGCVSSLMPRLVGKAVEWNKWRETQVMCNNLPAVEGVHSQ